MYLSKPAVLLALLPLIPLTIASSSCTSSDATAWPFGGDSSSDDTSSDDSSSFGSGTTTSGSDSSPPGSDSTLSGSDSTSSDSSIGSSSGGGGSITDACAQFKGDPTEYQACLAPALGGSDSAASGDSPIKKIRARAGTLMCTDDESCFQYANETLVCFDGATGTYHDDTGARGNLLEDAVGASSDGTMTATSRASTGSESASAMMTVSSMASMMTSGTMTMSGSATAASASAATATSTNAATALEVQALVCLLGVGAAVML